MTHNITLEADRITGRGRSLNPFVILKDVAGFIAFAEGVFEAKESVDVRTPTPTGELIRAELRVGDSLLLLADALPGWQHHPGLFQVWVSDAETVVKRAVERGATVVTPPTPFYGSLTLARIADPWRNLWWVYQPKPGQSDRSRSGTADRTPSFTRSTTICVLVAERGSGCEWPVECRSLE